ncbi:MAG: hypothetical protein IPM82_17575 [Saprospiraceae bacterium]|nr:hypothetical protein [Saprospiraceae bacterium]
MNFLKRLFSSKKETQPNAVNQEIRLQEDSYYPNPRIVKESEIEKFIRDSTSQEVEKWFNHYKAKGHYFFDSIYYSVQNKIAERDDEYYLSMLKEMDAEEVKEFMKVEKEEGTYFSEKVYDFAMRRMNQDKNLEYIDQIEKMTPEATLMWFLKQVDKNGFDYLDLDIEQKAHEKIFSIFIRGSISKQYRKKLFEYVFYSTSKWSRNREE